ncbi:MAG: hypothetical protein HF976_01665 [ANME-2 cluster archaeon]|nr:hypothetical protein [ANME-2 cluster archaeon]MBC2700116.1 hypothetical protein [ANME-2 cluster archaeon]MBC2748254.1 hypothetical protein [ANME-2 cluster archaeon]MBC2763093.1 hypothetical protein [ANME-2 cluster archaeon]
MKFRTDKDITKFIGISLCTILAGIIIILFIEPVSVFGFILILGGLIGLVIGLSVATKPKCDLIEDERSVKVREKAGYSAFIAMLLIATIIVLLRMLKLSPSLTPSIELTDGVRNIWIIGVWIFITFRWYYNKTGE